MKDIYFSAHALQRYKERFGIQSKEILEQRFRKSILISRWDNKETRQYGAIKFVSLADNDGNYNVLTIKK